MSHIPSRRHGPAHGAKEIGKDIVTYEYKQPVHMQPYLIAIAAGHFRYRALPKVDGKAWSTCVWAEPELIDAAYWEFSEATGKFLATAKTTHDRLVDYSRIQKSGGKGLRQHTDDLRRRYPN
ncbi:hypothetical protein L227DRAFT_614020 [Lentinus tigrinus ALCF2SS1-6]|uniref:Uncharacterized protein n=1 Tax=Lentinus tigrinus ALCF2SS1-6 TaxID=1328759 RepID=A0A5C2S2V9_9APHY|nr:hypothetical protein L227DRAFT_614020 [Lentinus tigrinus ALCF2SS1-6]